MSSSRSTGLALFLAWALAGPFACSRAPEVPGLDTVGPDLGRLRDAFNADRDKTRLILIVSPT